ncbi:MAG TPA: GspMb/PilO family protein [Phycisphaerae bacterium]|nr:GspMb/PilO family protein [Phycisphaerae bacterium]
MAFTQREKLILSAAIAAFGLLVLDYYVLGPLLEQRAAVGAERAKLDGEFAQARSLLERRRLLGRKWQQMLADGLQRDPAEAEGQMLRRLRDWSAEAGVRLSSLRPERSTEKTRLPEVTIHAAATGPLASVVRLLNRIETARVPVRIRMLQLGSRKDGTDDLSLHLRVSTLYEPDQRGATGAAQDRPPAGGAQP